MTGCILGNQYLPSAVFFAHWLHHGSVMLEAHEHYQKRTWRNKTAIVAPDQPLALTIPLLKGKHQQQPIQQVQIAHHEPWVKLHLQSLQAAYGKTAFYPEIRPGMESILQSRPETLWELNLKLIDFITQLIPGPWKVILTESYIPHYPASVTDERKGIPAGQWPVPMEDTHLYPQVRRLGKTHQANLSILDVICHLGPDTIDFLHRVAQKLYPST